MGASSLTKGWLETKNIKDFRTQNSIRETETDIKSADDHQHRTPDNFRNIKNLPKAKGGFMFTRTGSAMRHRWKPLGQKVETTGKRARQDATLTFQNKTGNVKTKTVTWLYEPNVNSVIKRRTKKTSCTANLKQSVCSATVTDLSAGRMIHWTCQDLEWPSCLMGLKPLPGAIRHS